MFVRNIFKVLNNQIIIRELKPAEHPILEDLLYEAVFQPNPADPIPRSIIFAPAVRTYIDNFGAQKDDYCLVAENEGKIIGGVWVRILAGEVKGFGNINAQTPEFAISVFPDFRRKGTGTLLMKTMLAYLKEKSYKQCSLSVQKENYARRLYLELGFEIVDENDEEFIMVLKL